VKFSADWVENAQNVAPEERATIANFRMWLAEQNVTMHLRERDNVSIESVLIALYSLAEGLAHDWWSLFGNRERVVSLIKHRTGFAVPDIRFRFDGIAFEATAFQKTYHNPPVRFWAGPTEVLTREQAEASLSEFIELVLSKLEMKGVRDTSAQLRWSRVKASRADSQEATFCESSGALGLDPYEIKDSDAALIESAAALFKKESLAEFLSGARGYNTDALLKWVKAAERRAKYKSCLSDLMAIARKAARTFPERTGDQSWALGYRRARGMRQALSLKQNDRIRTDKAFARKLGAAINFETAARVDGIRALRSHTTGDDVFVHLRDHGRSPQAQVAQLFSFSRAVGDVTCFPTPERSPVNELHSAYRQAAGRAFAAEFLAPIDEIKSMHADGHDAVTIADELFVSTTVIERQMENAQRIEAACA
jgi:hypothetical protein